MAVCESFAQTIFGRRKTAPALHVAFSNQPSEWMHSLHSARDGRSDIFHQPHCTLSSCSGLGLIFSVLCVAPAFFLFLLFFSSALMASSIPFGFLLFLHTLEFTLIITSIASRQKARAMLSIGFYDCVLRDTHYYYYYLCEH